MADMHEKTVSLTSVSSEKTDLEAKERLKSVDFHWQVSLSLQSIGQWALLKVVFVG